MKSSLIISIFELNWAYFWSPSIFNQIEIGFAITTTTNQSKEKKTEDS